MDSQKTLLVCTECKKTYKRKSALRRHVKKYHSDKLELIAPLMKKNCNFKCVYCVKQFNHKANLNYHIKKTHGVTVSKLNRKSKCTLCLFETAYKKDCIKHYEEIHNIKMEFEKQEFTTYDDFVVWKSRIEKETLAKYVKEHGTKSGITNYICHRSGFFISQSQGKRHLKSQGSNKINGFCPAKINVYQRENKFLVNFTKTHVGHQMELSHLVLTHSERQNVAAKLAANIPFDAVLDEIRDGILGSSSLERIHLLTKKDLHNIKACFNLHSTTLRHHNDTINIDCWVNEMKDKCILFYKPQEVCFDEYPQLRSDDFLLVIMNNCQKETFRKFANDCICIDYTPGTNSYQFELHTLLVLDDLKQGFPSAFCISSRSDETVMSVFFSCVKEAVGVVEAKVLMSDMDEVYYKAWSKVMCEPQFCLYCTWHVDRAWRENLSLISLKEAQSFTYKTLRTLLQETDVSAFEEMLKQFLMTVVKDPKTVKFGFYFRDYFVKNSKLWAYCYRMHSGLNTNMHLERMHQTIKYIYMHEKNVQRLDKAVNALMKFIRDKLFDRLIILNKGKLCSKMTQLRKRHTASLDLEMSVIVQEGNTWQIPSSSSKAELYTIYENDTNCSCQLFCTDCNACIHRYCCSCVDSAITWNMCKHIHLLCRYKRSEELQTNFQLKEEVDMDIVYDKLVKSETLFEQITSPQIKLEKRDLTIKKEEMLRKLYTIVNGINTEEEWKALQKMVNPIEHVLEAVRQQNGIN